jgi:hypothetical protein
MAEDYSFPITQCDVPLDRHSSLQAFRDERRQLVSFQDEDPDYAIWSTIFALVWNDDSF